MNLLKDEEFSQKLKKIIQNDYFPDTEKTTLMLSLLDQSDEIWSLQKTSEKMLKPHNNPSLTDFLEQHISKEHASFLKLNKNNRKKFLRDHWWVATKPEQPTEHNLLFQARGFQEAGFKKPGNWIVSKNAHLKTDFTISNPYTMPEISEKETLALKLAEKSGQSRRTSRQDTPSSRVSSIFPIYNYSLPSKRKRENSNH